MDPVWNLKLQLEKRQEKSMFSTQKYTCVNCYSGVDVVLSL